MAGLDPEKIRRWGLLAGIGPLLAAAVVVGYFLGVWLDRELGTSPWIMIAGVLLGAAAGFIEMVRLLERAGAGGARARRRREGGGRSGGNAGP